MVIDTARQLAAFCQELASASTIFIDTEFVGEGRYYPEVGAIQVATRDTAALIDPLAVTDLTPLLDILADPAVEKVFHAAGQDLQILYRLIGRPVAPVFDAQIAAALLGYDEQISFANLIQRVLGLRLDKSHGFTDWLRRPLSPGQIEYALDDVRYLAKVYDSLVEELRAKNRLDWAREEFQQLEREEKFAPADPYELYLRCRGVERMNSRARSSLRELIAWRELTARAQNIPIGRIGRDEVMMEIAQRPRKRVEELKSIRGIQSQQVSQFGAGLIEAAQRGAIAPPVECKRPPALPTYLEPTTDFLTLCLRSLAREKNVCPGVVATRGDLAAVVLSGEKAEVPLMRGWRREVIGEALLATLEGKATARILPENRQVHLQWHDPE